MTGLILRNLFWTRVVKGGNVSPPFLKGDEGGLDSVFEETQSHEFSICFKIPQSAFRNPKLGDDHGNDAANTQKRP
jgi:hypothetical protein